jgi:hypothetical protein
MRLTSLPEKEKCSQTAIGLRLLFAEQFIFAE